MLWQVERELGTGEPWYPTLDLASHCSPSGDIEERNLEKEDLEDLEGRSLSQTHYYSSFYLRKPKSL